jgi:hypothetical protein
MIPGIVDSYILASGGGGDEWQAGELGDGDDGAIMIEGLTASYSIAGLTASRIAFITESQLLRAYDYAAGVWSPVGSDFALSASFGANCMSALSASRVAIYDTGTDTLQAYDFNGSTWSAVGSAFSLALGGTTALTAMSSSRVALLNSGADLLQAYDFNGSIWSLFASTSVSPSGSPALAYLSCSEGAMFDTTDDELKTMSLIGTNWAQAGNALSMTGFSLTSLVRLRDSVVAHIEITTRILTAYEWDGSDFSSLVTIDIETALSLSTNVTVWPNSLAYMADDSLALLIGDNFPTIRLILTKIDAV